MDEREFQRQINQFFTQHEAGKLLRSRWQERVDRYTNDLIWCDDEKIRAVIQGILRYHERVIGPELSQPEE